MADVRDAPLSDLETNFSLLKNAARGDIAAQRALADQSVLLIGNRPDLNPIGLLNDGLIFARMAAMQGNAHDEGRVMSMLALMGDICGEFGDHDTGAACEAEGTAFAFDLTEQQ